ncbi:unnamed protein product, partial [Mesorhabditis spiculigera]
MNRERGRLRVAVVAAIVTVSEYGPPAHVPIYINPYPQVPEDSSSKEDRGPAPPVDGYQNLILGDREPAQQQRDQPPARGPAPPKNAHPQQSRLDEIARQVQKLLQDDQGNVDLNKVPKPVNKPGSKAPGFSPKRRNTMREAENIVKRSGYEAVPKTRTNDGLTIHSSGYNFDGEDLPPTETGSPSYPADEPDQSNYGNNNDGDDGIDEGENTNEGGYPRIQKGYRQKTTTTTTTTRRPTTTTRRTTTTQRTTTTRRTPAPTTTKRPAPQRATTTQEYDAPPVAHPPTTTQPPIDEGYVTEAAAPAPYGGNNIQPEHQPPVDQQYEETHKVDPYAALAEHSSGTPPPLGAHDLLSLDAKAYVEEHKRMQRAMAKKIYSEMRRQLKRELGFGESLSASSDAEHENEEKDASAEKLKGAELPALAGYQGPEPSGYDSAVPAPEPTTVHPDTGYGGEETTVAETTIAPVTLPAHIRTIVANFAKQMEKQAKKTRAEASGQATTPKEFSFDGSADRATPATPSDGYDTVTQGYDEPTEEKPRNGGGAQGAYGGYSASHGAPSPTSIQDKASGEQEEEEYPKRRGARFVPFHQDGEKLRVPLVWLRDHCRNTASYNHQTEQRKMDCCGLTSRAVLRADDRAIRINSDGILEIEWLDGLQSSFTAEQLKSWGQMSKPVKSSDLHELWTGISLKEMPRIPF